jgi:hypothetical protein
VAFCGTGGGEGGSLGVIFGVTATCPLLELCKAAEGLRLKKKQAQLGNLWKSGVLLHQGP